MQFIARPSTSSPPDDVQHNPWTVEFSLQKNRSDQSTFFDRTNVYHHGISSTISSFAVQGWLFFFFQILHRSARVICERDTKSHARHIPFSAPAHAQRLTKDSHNTGNFMPCSFRIVCGFFNVLQWTYINMEGNCETGPTVYRPYPRRLERLTICWFNYKLSTQLF